MTTEAVIKGNTATFLVGDSGGATAVTRGVNGLLPGRADNLTPNSATLVAWHDKPIKTGFNILASKGNQRAWMQKTAMGVINRKIDQDSLTELATATIGLGSTTTFSLALAMHAKTRLDCHHGEAARTRGLEFATCPSPGLSHIRYGPGCTTAHG